jgi:hypothetical protein
MQAYNFQCRNYYTNCPSVYQVKWTKTGTKNTASSDYYCRLHVQWHKCQNWQNKSKPKNNIQIETLRKFVRMQVMIMCVQKRKRKHKFWWTRGARPSTQLWEMRDSSQLDEVKSSLPHSLNEQSSNENVILSDKSCNVISNTLQNANATTEDYQ